MRTARVFPRRVRATPTDDLSFIGHPPIVPPEISAVQVSVTFTWDLPEAHRIADAWSRIAPTAIGGPATGERGEDFVAGRYLAPGYTITSRGCPNRCWFCSVPKREGGLRELPIVDGWNVLDDNLLACSPEHRRAVFAMLARQPKRPQFTGGLEAARMTPDIAAELRALRPEALFFAYDTPDDLPHLQHAAKLLRDVGQPFAGHRVRAYVLCGYPKDTIPAAERRMGEVMALGIFPAAMVWRGPSGDVPGDNWRRFARQWQRPAIINANARVARNAEVPR